MTIDDDSTCNVMYNKTFIFLNKCHTNLHFVCSFPLFILSTF